MDTSKAVVIWEFFDAPENYRKLSGHGGDEDWIVFIPVGCNVWPIRWMFEDDSYVGGWGHVEKHSLTEGEVIIFAHS